MSIRNFFSTSGGELSPALIIRRVLFLVLLLGLTLFNLALDFNGLSHPKGIEQAQISREIARGKQFTTKMIRPLALNQLNSERRQNGEEGLPLTAVYDTYHAPLNPLLNSVPLKFFESSWDWLALQEEMKKQDKKVRVYPLDRVIALGATLLLLCSIGIAYLLVSRIFDSKIGGVTALLLLICELLWDFTKSGLPQCLMLFLFMFAMYFLYKAIENAQLDRSPVLWLCLTGGFFGLLALAHWITIWAFLGLFVFVAIYFRPRGAAAAYMAAVFLLVIAPWGLRNLGETGTPLGSAYFAALSGDESVVMRNYDPEANPFSLQGLPTRLISTSLDQINGLYAYFGSIVVAPLFFLSLLHPFKRPEIAGFRWCIVLMWVISVLGMSLFGLRGGENDPNNIHILFAPLMTAYGLALLSVLWTRLGITSTLPMVMNGHLIIVVLISALPLVLTLFPDIKRGLYTKEQGSLALQIAQLGKVADAGEVIVTDMPWSVAWYGDRTALWLPVSLTQYEELREYAEERKNPFVGVLLTPESTNASLATDILRGKWSEWSQLVVRGGLLEHLKTSNGRELDVRMPSVLSEWGRYSPDPRRPGGILRMSRDGLVMFYTTDSRTQRFYGIE